MRQKRYTYLGFICYCIEDVKSICNDKKVECYAYVLHQPEGDKKQLHWHIVVKLNEQDTTEYFFNRKQFLQNVRVAGLEKKQGAFKAFEYLVHKNDPEKIQYSWDEVVSNVDLSFWQKLGGKSNCNTEFVVDLQNLTPVEMAYKYGRDFIKNYKSYLQFKADFLDIVQRDLDYDVDPWTGEQQKIEGVLK